MSCLSNEVELYVFSSTWITLGLGEQSYGQGQKSHSSGSEVCNDW